MLIRIALIVCFLWSNFSFAWNSSGHQIIAAITWDLLTQEQREYWTEVLKQHPRFEQDFLANKPKDVKKDPTLESEWIFRQASIWPDVVRGLPKPLLDLYHHGSWHYVNIPIYLNQPFNTDHINTDTEFHGSFHNGINVIQATQGHIQTLLKPGMSKKHQAFALSWLLHTVADSHQPMHCSSLASENYFPNGDQGGNDIPIQGQGQINNLHWFWDWSLHGSLSFKIIDQHAESIKNSSSIDISSHQSSSVKQWVQNCYEVAKARAYTPMMLKKIRNNEKQNNPIPKIYISEVYAQQARTVAREQAFKAALEIKAILDSVIIE